MLHTEVTPQLTVKTCCLALWRMGRGKLYAKVRITPASLHELVRDIGLPASPTDVRNAMEKLLIQSLVEKARESTETITYKITSKTCEAASAAAKELGTVLLPDLPGAAPVADVAEPCAGVVAPVSPAVRTAALIDDLLDVLSIASEAQTLRKQLEAVSADRDRLQLEVGKMNEVALADDDLNSLASTVSMLKLIHSSAVGDGLEASMMRTLVERVLKVDLNYIQGLADQLNKFHAQLCDF